MVSTEEVCTAKYGSAKQFCRAENHVFFAARQRQSGQKTAKRLPTVSVAQVQELHVNKGAYFKHRGKAIFHGSMLADIRAVDN